MEAEGGGYVILKLFHVAEMWLDTNLLKTYEKKTKMFLQASTSKPSLARVLCSPKTDEKINREEE